MAIAAVLNAVTTRTSITTIMRIQATGCELFLLHSRLTPDRLRIEMSRTLGVIRAARSGEAAARPSPEARPVSLVTGRGTDQAGGHAGKRPVEPRGIQLDESQDPRAADNLIRRSGHIVHDRLLWSLRWARHSTVVCTGRALSSGLATVLATVTAPGADPRPSAFQAGHIPSWRGSCESYALSAVAAVSGWLLLLLSPLLLLSRWSRVRLPSAVGKVSRR